MQEFAMEHPIVVLLIVSTVVSGVVAIIRGRSRKER